MCPGGAKRFFFVGLAECLLSIESKLSFTQRRRAGGGGSETLLSCYNSINHNVVKFDYLSLCIFTVLFCFCA